MTTPAATAAAPGAATTIGLANVVRSEWTKLRTVRGFPHDRDVRVHIQDQSEPGPYERLVVSQENADHVVSKSSGKRATTRHPPSH